MDYYIESQYSKALELLSSFLFMDHHKKIEERIFKKRER